MNYQTIYNNLIAKCKNRSTTPNEYMENHHILPRCMGGNNCKDNLVYLSLREHFLAHWLLCKIYPNEWKLYFALFQMCRVPGSTKRIVTSRQFEQARKLLRRGALLRYKQNQHPRITQDGRNKIREGMLGEKNPMRRFPEKNASSIPCRVHFIDGTTRDFLSGKSALEQLNIPRSTWILARRTKTSIKKFGILKIENLEKITA